MTNYFPPLRLPVEEEPVSKHRFPYEEAKVPELFFQDFNSFRPDSFKIPSIFHFDFNQLSDEKRRQMESNPSDYFNYGISLTLSFRIYRKDMESLC